MRFKNNKRRREYGFKSQTPSPSTDHKLKKVKGTGADDIVMPPAEKILISLKELREERERLMNEIQGLKDQINQKEQEIQERNGQQLQEALQDNERLRQQQDIMLCRTPAI